MDFMLFLLHRIDAELVDMVSEPEYYPRRVKLVNSRQPKWSKGTNSEIVCYTQNKPVGGRDHEVLGMGSFGEYRPKLYGKST
jgi:hypothetical protein